MFSIFKKDKNIGVGKSIKKCMFQKKHYKSNTGTRHVAWLPVVQLFNLTQDWNSAFIHCLLFVFQSILTTYLKDMKGKCVKRVLRPRISDNQSWKHGGLMIKLEAILINIYFWT